MSGPRVELRRAFMARSRAVGDGHRRWTGAKPVKGVALVPLPGGGKRSASRVAFVLRYGREPVGYVKAFCGPLWCIAPAHQEDRAMREARRDAERRARALAEAKDVDDTAVLLALHGRREGTLNPAEKRAAVALAPASMPVVRLARRIGACTRTVKALRAELTAAGGVL